MLLENEFGCTAKIYNEVIDEDVANPFLDVNEIIDWLKLNKPRNEKEIDSLIWIILELKTNGEVSDGRYEIIEMSDQLLIIGPRNMLFIQGEELVDYLLELLFGLKEELNGIATDEEVGWAA